MNKKLVAELSKMTDVEFFTLEHHVSIARMVRDTMSKNGIDEKQMAEKLGVRLSKMKSVYNGSYPFDLMFLSKLQAFNMGIATEKARFKIEAEGIQFSEYKGQYPRFVKRIDQLLNKLEASESSVTKQP